mgnify:CR=1 FL=1
MLQHIKCLVTGHEYYVTKDRISTVTLECTNCNKHKWCYKQESNVTPETYNMGNSIEHEQEQEHEQEHECE